MSYLFNAKSVEVQRNYEVRNFILDFLSVKFKWPFSWYFVQHNSRGLSEACKHHRWGEFILYSNDEPYSLIGKKIKIGTHPISFRELNLFKCECHTCLQGKKSEIELYFLKFVYRAELIALSYEWISPMGQLVFFTFLFA